MSVENTSTKAQLGSSSAESETLLKDLAFVLRGVRNTNDPIDSEAGFCTDGTCVEMARASIAFFEARASLQPATPVEAATPTDREQLIALIRSKARVDGHDAWEGGYYHLANADEIADAILALPRDIAQPKREPLAGAIAEYASDIRRNASGGDDYPWGIMRGVADSLEEILNYSGGAESPLHDEYVMERAKAVLSSLSSTDGAAK